MTAPVPPGATLGVLGSGQLGRMFAIAARQLGYRVHTFSPDRDTPTGQVADREVAAPYDDLDAIRAFARGVDVVTFEFENIPSATVAAAEALVAVRPGRQALHVAQHRLREKTFLRQHGFPVANFAPLVQGTDLDTALSRVSYPAILKTAAFGYDGKGQQRVSNSASAREALTAFAGADTVIEEEVDLALELSVVAARGVDGATAFYGPLENAHARHILDVTVAPAQVDPRVAADARAVAEAIARALEYVGVLCVEFFLDTAGRLLVNELAPRPHNSGHYSIDACATSQFEQQVRAVCGLPLGSTEQARPAAMANLLGDLWAGGVPYWAAALAMPGVKLHLYGKAEPRPGRKMGHLTAIADTVEDARERALHARAALCR